MSNKNKKNYKKKILIIIGIILLLIYYWICNKNTEEYDYIGKACLKNKRSSNRKLSIDRN